MKLYLGAKRRGRTQILDPFFFLLSFAVWEKTRLKRMLMIGFKKKRKILDKNAKALTIAIFGF